MYAAQNLGGKVEATRRKRVVEVELRSNTEVSGDRLEMYKSKSVALSMRFDFGSNSSIRGSYLNGVSVRCGWHR